MSNTKKIASIAFTGAAVAATTTYMAVGPAAGPAAAGPAGYRVKYGGFCFPAVMGKLKAGTSAVLVDTTKHTTLTCKKAFLSGQMSHSVGPQIGFLKKSVTNWSSCTGPAGFTFKAKLITLPKIILAPGSSGKLSGNKISIKITGSGLFSTCKATISGTSIPWKYANATHSFVINSGHASTLHVKATSGFCANAINISDHVYFAGTYHVSCPASLAISRS